MWQQQLLEASYRWATGYAFHLEKLGGLRRPNTYRAAHCMGELAPWLEGLSVHVYDDRLHPMAFTEGWGVDAGARQVWVDRELVERQLAQPEDKFQGANWFDQGWAEMWVLVAGAMGAPRHLVEPALEKSRLRTFLDKTQHVQCWEAPELLGVLGAGQCDLADKPLPPPLRESLTGDRARAFGWPFAKSRSDMWPASDEHWIKWAKAAYYLHVQKGLETQPDQVEAFLEAALAENSEPEWSFWLDQARPGLEERRPGLLRMAHSPAAIVRLVEKGADPNAVGFSETCPEESILSFALRFRPHLVACLVAAGSRWSTVPSSVNPWEEMAVHLGQAIPEEWNAIEQGLRLIPDTFPLQGEHLAKMVGAFSKSHSFRGDYALKAAEMMDHTLRWAGQSFPGLDWIPVLKQLTCVVCPAFSGSLAYVLERIEGLDFNQVKLEHGQRLPVALLKSAVLSVLRPPEKQEAGENWWPLWERAGVRWELTEEEEAGLSGSSQELYLTLRGAQRAQLKEAALKQNLPAVEGEPASPSPRRRF